MKKLFICTMLAAGILMLAGCHSSEKNNEAAPQASTEKMEKITIKVTIMNEEKEVAAKKLTVQKDENLMEIMDKSFDMKEENGMITEIEGIEQNTEKSYFWTYTINNEMVNTGAAETKVKDADEVVFTYAKF